MNKLPKIIYPILFGILMWICWPPFQYTFFIVFFGFIPLFQLENKINKNGFKPLQTFFYGYFSFLIWNILTTWWVALADIGGGVAAMTLNSLLMSIPFYLFAYGKSKLGNKIISYLLFICFWMGFEQIHLQWELTWPWLTLGNSFSENVWAAKLFSITGVWGGSVLILLSNSLIYLYLENRKQNRKYIYIAFSSILGFILLGILLFPKFNYERKGNIIMVQPNYDAYTEKFSIPSYVQQEKMIHLTDSVADDSTLMVLWPETSIVEEFNESNPLGYAPIIKNVNWMTTKKFALVAGTNSQNLYMDAKEKPTVTAREHSQIDQNGNTIHYYFDLYNSATFFSGLNRDIRFYHKSRLVPGVERMPYPGFFAFLEPLTIKMGGTFGSVGTQDTPSVFNYKGIKLAPVICYESIFGDYVSRYIQRDANVIGVITNDDWWGRSPGYLQHFSYGKLRAIESGRYIYRAANTGITGVISPDGQVIQKIDYKLRGVIKYPLYLTEQKTIYSIISEWFRWISYALFILAFIYILLVKKPNKTL